jgi:hypothetical protein
MSERQSELRRLDALVGLWDSQGHTIANGGPAIEIKGTDTYEWFPGEFFLVHRADVLVGDERVNVLEMIGPYDAATRTYPMRSFDSQGNFIVMQASLNDAGSWTFEGISERATLTINPDLDSMTAHWEQLRDNDWHPWMEMTFTRR